MNNWIDNGGEGQSVCDRRWRVYCFLARKASSLQGLHCPWNRQRRTQLVYFSSFHSSVLPPRFHFLGREAFSTFFFFHFGGFISSYMSSIYVGLISLENCLFVCP